MTNIFAVLFQVGMALFVLRAVLAERLPVGSMVGAGLCLGLALSTRWTSLWAAAFLGLVVLLVRGARLLRPREVALLALAFVGLPAALYTLSYVPWMMQGHSFMDMVRWQRDIWHYHATLNAPHPYFSEWYTWPWLYRPTWYYFKQSGETVSGIVAIGNPALWWAAVPATLWSLITGIRRRDPRRIFTGVGFCGLYLPWGISPRTLNYSHYLFEAIPYACLSLGAMLDGEWEGPMFALARGYLLLTVFLFLFFYPFLAAVPVPAELFNHPVFDGVRPWTWFPKWV